MTKPYDVNNERSVLAGVLLDKAVRRKVVGYLKPVEFQGVEHRAIYEAVLAAGDEAELDTEVLLLCDERGKVDRGLVEDLMARVRVPANIDRHLQTMRRDYLRLAAVPAVERLLEALKDRTIKHDECTKAAAGVLSGLSDVGVTASSGGALADQYMAEVDQRRNGEVPFVTTGYPVLDEFMNEGLARERVSVLAARPRIGKTHVVVDLVTRLLRATKLRILVLPLEPGRMRFIDMMVCNAMGIPISSLTKYPEELTTAARDEIDRNVRKMIGTDDRLTILDNPFAALKRWNNDTAMDKSEELYAVGGFDLVVTDLWARKLTRRDPEEVSRALAREQSMAQKYKLHSLMVHHISRKAEERKDKRPELTDLKESGAWEEVVDLALGLHREKVYKQHLRADRMEVIVLKQRLGGGGDVMEADFVGGQFRLENERALDKAARKPTNAARFAADADDGPV